MFLPIHSAWSSSASMKGNFVKLVSMIANYNSNALISIYQWKQYATWDMWKVYKLHKAVMGKKCKYINIMGKKCK